MSEQLSFFSAGVTGPSPADLEGLLAGPGHVVRRGGTARISVVLGPNESWRPAALMAELAPLGITAELAERTAADGVVVRTQFSPRLLNLALRWSRGASTVPPSGWTLDGARLRWWVIAAGGADAAGYLLRLAPGAPGAWNAIGGALQSVGLPATFLGTRAAGPAYRIVSLRRLRRLRELVGPPPTGAPAAAWPVTDPGTPAQRP